MQYIRRADPRSGRVIKGEHKLQISFFNAYNNLGRRPIVYIYIGHLIRTTIQRLNHVDLPFLSVDIALSISFKANAHGRL